MALPPRPSTAEEDVALPFQQAALMSGVDQDPLFSHITPSILPPEEALPLSERNSNQVCMLLLCNPANGLNQKQGQILSTIKARHKSCQNACSSRKS